MIKESLYVDGNSFQMKLELVLLCFGTIRFEILRDYCYGIIAPFQKIIQYSFIRFHFQDLQKVRSQYRSTA